MSSDPSRPLKPTGREKINKNQHLLTEEPGSQNSSRKSPSANAGSGIGADDIGHMAMKLQKVSAENGKQKKDLDQAKKEVSELQKKLQIATQDNKKQQKTLDKSKKDLSDLQKKMELLSDEKNKLEKALKLLQTNTKAEREKLEKQKVDELQACQNKLIAAETKNKQREKELNELQSKSKNAEAECKLHDKKLNDLQTKLTAAETKIKQHEKEVNELQSRLNTALTECNRGKQEYKDLKAQIETADAALKKKGQELDILKEETTNRIHELTSANDQLRTRLSAQLGAKLQDNNPNIADLSDPNRPTKLADQFSGFYDDEWTNSYEVIMKARKSEEVVVDMLLAACVTIYNDCLARASADLQHLHAVFALFNSGSDTQLVKRLKDERKKYKADKKLRNQIEDDMTNVFGKDLFEHKKITTYVQKCIDICWAMSIQDPPVFMDTQIDRKGKPFDNEAYRPYTQAGPLVKFIVWPAIYLNEGGSLLFKGVAQGMVE